MLVWSGLLRVDIMHSYALSSSEREKDNVLVPCEPRYYCQQRVVVKTVVMIYARNELQVFDRQISFPELVHVIPKFSRVAEFE